MTMTPYLIKGEIDCESTECGACSFLRIVTGGAFQYSCSLHGQTITAVITPGSTRALRLGRCIQAESRARKAAKKEQLLVDVVRYIGERSRPVVELVGLGMPWHDWMRRLRGISTRLYNDVLNGRDPDEQDSQ